MLRRFLLTSAALSGLWISALPAVAQDAPIAVRSGAHDQYTRLVFDWPQGVTYKAQESADKRKLTLTFDENATLDLSAFRAGGGIESVSPAPAGGQLIVTLNLGAGVSVRHFMVGNKLVVDAYGAAAPQKLATAAPAPKKTETPPKKAVEKAPEKAAAPEPAPAPVSDLAPAASPTETVEKTVLEQAAHPALETHLITWSATETFGMAAFLRDDMLWVVSDKPSITLPPKVDGPQKSLFPPFKMAEAENGSAFYMPIPREVPRDIRADGGGLVWKIAIPTKDKEDKSTAPERRYDEKKEPRGGTVLWPLATATEVVTVKDPVMKDTIKVAAVDRGGYYAGAGMIFADFSTLPSYAGLALVPVADDLEVDVTREGVEVTRPGGLALSPQSDVSRRLMREHVQEVSVVAEAPLPGGIKRIFDFDRWMMGGIGALADNERILKAATFSKDSDGQVQDLMTLAKMNIANDRAEEALGYLEIAREQMPPISDNLEFGALMAAAHALSGQYELAWGDLGRTGLEEFSELGYWKAYVLAWLEDWEQAYEFLPQDLSVLVSYPRPLLEKMGIRLAEVALRGGDVERGGEILEALEVDRAALKPWTLAGLDYLKGEAARQQGELARARELWTPLAEGKDEFYRARGGLALTVLEIQEKKLTQEQAIDRLEGLRYSWRGDELEAQINYDLGKYYIDQGQLLKGLTILRDASTMALPDSDIGKDIAAYMTRTYENIMLGEGPLEPLDAVTLYEEFKELTPSDEKGDEIVQKLAERLVQADLLARAAKLLQHQVDFRLQGAEKARVALRLAAIYLLDKNPRPAMETLEKAREIYNTDTTINPDIKREKIKDIDLLLARALSKINRTEEALEILSKFQPESDVHMLRADIAWQAGLWEDAAEALQDLIIDEGLDLNRPLNQKQADLILNRVVALNLSGNRVALANMRSKYGPAMEKTNRSRLFDVVTRPRKVSTLADRETISSIVGEVDLFKDFLEGYKQAAQDQATTAPPEPQR